MRRIFTIGLQLALATFFFETGFCIKCYVCSSYSEPECENPSNNYKLETVECSADRVEYTYDLISRVYSKYNQHWSVQSPNRDYHCAKLIGYNQQTNTNKTIFRGCLPAKNDIYDSCRELTRNISSSSGISYCDTCYSEGCNSSNRITNALTAMLLPLIIMFVTRQ